jgi:hypothetical protein
LERDARGCERSSLEKCASSEPAHRSYGIVTRARLRSSFASGSSIGSAATCRTAPTAHRAAARSYAEPCAHHTQSSHAPGKAWLVPCNHAAEPEHFRERDWRPWRKHRYGDQAGAEYCSCVAPGPQGASRADSMASVLSAGPRYAADFIRRSSRHEQAIFERLPHQARSG